MTLSELFDVKKQFDYVTNGTWLVSGDSLVLITYCGDQKWQATSWTIESNTDRGQGYWWSDQVRLEASQGDKLNELDLSKMIGRSTRLHQFRILTNKEAAEIIANLPTVGLR